MKFGTKVTVSRGSRNAGVDQRHCAYGKVVGARGEKLLVKLTKTDALATQGPKKVGDMGWFGKRSIAAV